MGSSTEQQQQQQQQQQQHHHHQQPQQQPQQQQDEKRQTYNLCWNEFPTNLLSFFKELREQEEFVDVTLACEGQQVSAHKVVLSACSPYFRSLLKNNPCDHPIIILNEVGYSELVTLLQYMYHGEVQIVHDQITDFLRTAKLLQIRGLAEAAKAESRARSPEGRRENGPQQPPPPPPAAVAAREAPTPTPKLDPVEPEEETRPPDSPQVKRIKLSSGVGAPPPSSPSPHLSGGPSPPAPTPPIPSLPLSMANMASMAGLPSLPPIGLPGASLPLSLPSSITALPPVSTAHPPSIHHGRPSLHTSTPTSQQQPPFPGMYPGICSEDTQDTMGSDRSEDRDKSRHDDDDYDHENTLEKMSGLANMAALKSFGGFPGPSGLAGLASAALGGNSDSNPGRPRFDFYRVRATDPRPCHICGKIYKNAHTLRTHMEDKHSNCNGFRCVLCGTVAKSRNSLHSHMSRQHRGVSTKDLPLLPMPAPWDPEMAAKYIQIVGGVGEVVRQNYRRPERERDGNNSGSDNGSSTTTASRDREADHTPTSQENGGLYFKPDSVGRDGEDGLKERRPYDAISRHLDMYTGAKPPGASLLDTYLQMMRATGMDLATPAVDNMQDERKFLHSRPMGGGVLDLTRPDMLRANTSPRDDDNGGQASDDFSEDELGSVNLDGGGTRKLGGGATVVTVTPRSPEPSDPEDDAKWAVQ